MTFIFKRILKLLSDDRPVVLEGVSPFVHINRRTDGKSQR